MGNLRPRPPLTGRVLELRCFLQRVWGPEKLRFSYSAPTSVPVLCLHSPFLQDLGRGWRESVGRGSPWRAPGVERARAGRGVMGEAWARGLRGLEGLGQAPSVLQVAEGPLEQKQLGECG